jgi:lipopolysaccharide export system permease protein
VVALFLVVDFAEHSSVFAGPGWFQAVLALYAHRALVVAYQTAPAAMLLAPAITASDLPRTREYTALRALGLGPWRVAWPRRC